LIKKTSGLIPQLHTWMFRTGTTIRILWLHMEILVFFVEEIE
jgi:hypothetical protein